MEIKLVLPDETAQRLGSSSDEVARKILELAAAEGVRADVLSQADVRELLGLESSIEVLDFLAERRVPVG